MCPVSYCFVVRERVASRRQRTRAGQHACGDQDNVRLPGAYFLAQAAQVPSISTMVLEGTKPLLCAARSSAREMP